MTRSPSCSPCVISVTSPCWMPEHDGLELRGLAAGGHEHSRLPWILTSALVGTTSAFGCRSTVNRTRAYMPGFSRNPGFGTSTSICAVRVAGSRTGATRCHARRKGLAGIRRRPQHLQGSLLDAAEILLDHVGDEPDETDVDDGEERGVRRDPRARVETPPGDETNDR